MPELQNDLKQDIKPLPLPFYMKLFSYIVATVILMVILNTFLPTISEYITLWFKKVNLIDSKTEIEKWDIYSFIGMLYLSWCIIRFLALTWRKNEKIEIGTAVTSFPNPFYDPNYEKNQVDLQNKYNKLVKDYNRNMELLKESDGAQKNLQESINQLYNRIKIMLRHTNNSNRLIRSLNYAFYKEDKGKYSTTECLKLVLEECITILEKDQNDKSITLFKIVENELIVASSVRINFESVDKRKFKLNEGFAGYIWSKNAPEIINNIDLTDNRFAGGGLPVTKIGSIMGFPLNVDDEIIGVFCIQSEDAEGFIEEDLVTVELYARICTLILLYDKINKTEG